MTAIQADVVLVGGGIMSATLGMLLQRLDPSLHILMLEQLPEVAQESSAPLHNAGTGHAGYCELNYTPQGANGQIAIQRALEIHAAFETSLQFWSYLVREDPAIDAASFINRVPHLSAVWDAKGCDYLQARHQKLQQHHFFAGMQWSQDPATLQAWMPLIMAGRPQGQSIAATRVAQGADVNFGALTRLLVSQLAQKENFKLLTSTRVSRLKQRHGARRRWVIQAEQSGVGPLIIETPFLFLGAGGSALTLLQKSGIPEAAGYGGFPVSGQWLICQSPERVSQHHAKVYSLAPVGAPPMSVPHLDTRIIDGKPCLLFGPYAGFTTRFLKQGSLLDLPRSVKPHNLRSLLGAGASNLDLTRYLIREACKDHPERMVSLQEFMPTARADEWTLSHAGKRVQIIKRCDKQWGKLEFGTEIVAAADGSLAALLGASPGASVSVRTMLDVVERCFPQQLQSAAWQETLREMIPAYGHSLIEEADLAERIKAYTHATLGLLD